MAKIDQQGALYVLTRPRLLEIAEAFELDVHPRIRKGDLIDILARSRRAPFRRILDLLKRDELKAICQVSGIDDSGREKAVIADRILRRGLRIAPREGAGRGTVRDEVETLTKADLVMEVVGETGISRAQAEVVVSTALGSLVEALRSGSTIELRGFGSFGIRHRNPRIGRNPKTGAKVRVPAKRVPFFKPGKGLKELLNS